MLVQNYLDRINPVDPWQYINNAFGWLRNFFTPEEQQLVWNRLCEEKNNQKTYMLEQLSVLNPEFASFETARSYLIMQLEDPDPQKYDRTNPYNYLSGEAYFSIVLYDQAKMDMFVSLIIIHKMDRFERNFRAMTNTLEDLANIGVRVYSIHENLELANTLTVNLFGIINEHYIQNLSWETAKGKHQAAKEGYFIGSRVPFGYRKWKLGDSPEIDKRMLIVDEKEAAALRHCFEMYSTGSCSFSNLADYLNESGFVSRSGRAFRDDTLRSMLENPIYIGIIEYQGTKKETYLTYKGKHQP